MGLLEFSMHPSQILSVKNEILNSDLRLLEPQVKKVLRATEPAAISAAMAQLQALHAEPAVAEAKVAARRR
jgi:phosphotransferase system enzyme I (PtsI)